MADEAKRVRIKLIKSPIGYNKRQKATVRALGLTRLQAEREIVLTPHMRGMINTVSHMLEVVEMDDEDAQDGAT